MKTHFIPIQGGQLATYSEGQGAPLIFLHGGPGDTHNYMKRMAKPFFKDYQCIFFDQRGTGKSTITNREPTQFNFDLLLQDLFAVQNYYNATPATLIGHSWGGMYGLYACMHSPQRFKKAALLNTGPVDPQMETQSYENILAAVTDSEKLEWDQLNVKRTQALDAGDVDDVTNIDKKIMVLRVKGWIFDPNLRDAFLTQYFQDPPTDREVNKWVWQSAKNFFNWDNVKNNTTKTWLCVGQNDVIPVSQAQKLQKILPNALLTIIDKCGHIPWHEQPEAFYSNLKTFLAD